MDIIDQPAPPRTVDDRIAATRDRLVAALTLAASLYGAEVAALTVSTEDGEIVLASIGPALVELPAAGEPAGDLDEAHARVAVPFRLDDGRVGKLVLMGHAPVRTASADLPERLAEIIEPLASRFARFICPGAGAAEGSRQDPRLVYCANLVDAARGSVEDLTAALQDRPALHAEAQAALTAIRAAAKLLAQPA